MEEFMSEKKQKAMQKNVSSLGALAIVVGMIIGSGIFLKPGIVLRAAESPMMSIFAWIAGGIITLASALSVAEISSAIPKNGGLYVYLEELYGERWGFLLGWVQSVISYPASVAAQAIAFAISASFFLPLDPMQQKFLALGVLAFLLIMNILSTKYGSYIQIAATIGKLIPVIAIIGVGLFAGIAPGSAGLGMSSAKNLSGLGAAILGTLWAYDGWIGVTNMTGEIKNPEKKLPMIIGGGVVFVIAIYVVFNMAIFFTLPQDAIIASKNPGIDTANALFGPAGGAFISAGIMISVFGALNGYLMTAARVPQAMGERKALPFANFLGKLHPKFQTPTNALIFESILAVVYILSGSFNTLTDMLIFVLWIFFTMGVAGVFILRKKHGKGKGYTVPLYPIVPLIGILGGLYIIINTIMTSPRLSFTGIGVTLIGLPVYYYLKKKKAN